MREGLREGRGVRDGPFLWTYFLNPNNARLSAEPPTHLQVRASRKRKIRTPEEPFYYLHRMCKYHGFLKLWIPAIHEY